MSIYYSKLLPVSMNLSHRPMAISSSVALPAMRRFRANSARSVTRSAVRPIACQRPTVRSVHLIRTITIPSFSKWCWTIMRKILIYGDMIEIIIPACYFTSLKRPYSYPFHADPSDKCHHAWSMRGTQYLWSRRPFSFREIPGLIVLCVKAASGKPWLAADTQPQKAFSSRCAEPGGQQIEPARYWVRRFQRCCWAHDQSHPASSANSETEQISLENVLTPASILFLRPISLERPVFGYFSTR